MAIVSQSFIYDMLKALWFDCYYTVSFLIAFLLHQNRRSPNTKIGPNLSRNGCLRQK